MKVLYIGHYKEFGGWSRAAKDYILALDSVGVDVVCRNVTLTQDREISGRLKELEEKDTQGCDVCIQHVLPHHLVGTSKFKKNIAFLASESLSIKGLSWFNMIEQMDQLWVPNSQSKKFLEDDDLKIPVAVVPHTFNLDKYKKNYQAAQIPHAQDNFTFYYIGDLNDRKNLETIITCFHSEFDKSEDVSLVLKINKFGHTPEQLHQIVEQKLQQIKSKLRIYRETSEYKKDIVIPNELTEDQICSVHKACDCFICPSHGEAWSIPSFDAMAFGNTPICSNFGGPPEFITEDMSTGRLIDGVYASCKCSDSAFPDMFTAKEFWFVPCEHQIRKQMRFYYSRYKEDPIRHKKESAMAGLQSAERFSYENIGQLMKEIINA
tara:strand:- start:673 stop:1806 length:1134 start_codon:yes stop_codon:yes gene_type:complete